MDSFMGQPISRDPGQVKIAVLASRQDRSNLKPVLEILARLGIPSFALSIGPEWIDLAGQRIQALLGEASHLVLVANRHSFVDSWFSFAVGYATRLSGGLSLLRQDASWDPPAYLGGLPVLDDLDELEAFFRLKKSEWSRDESRDSARTKLLDRGIPCTTESFGECVAEGDSGDARLFLQAGFDPDSRNRHGVTMLCLAVRNRHLAVAEALLESGAAIDLKADDRGYTPLMDAVKYGPPEHVAFFLDRGADPNIESKDGQSALVIAVGRQDLMSARLLLEHGADPDIADKLGMSARSYSRLFKLPDFTSLFAEFPPIDPQ